MARTNYKQLLINNPDLSIDHNKYNINVTSNQGELIVPHEIDSFIMNHKGASLPAHLYFHIPYCDYICKFCNYVKTKISREVQKRTQTMDRIIQALIKESEMHLKKFSWIKESKIESIYFGGGTAAIMSAQHLQSLLYHIYQNYNVASKVEISMEGNPDNFIKNNKIDEFIEVGINRFSVGVQSLNNKVLKFTGRKHSTFMSLQVISNLLLKKIPFNIDYMYGLPYQTINGVVEDIKKLTRMNVPTITVYRFRNADREKMGIGIRSNWNLKKVREKMEMNFLFPDLEDIYQMREGIVDIFLKQDYSPSPCGWWSKPGTYGSYNIPAVSRNKWQKFDTMLAFGPGVYRWFTGNSIDIFQSHNKVNINEYLDCIENKGELPHSFGRRISGYASIATRLGFNLKAFQPIELKKYFHRFKIDLLSDRVIGSILNLLLKKKFLTFSKDKSSLLVTYDGESLHEEIISFYLHEKIGHFSTSICNRLADNRLLS